MQARDSSTQVSYEEDGEEVSKADGYGAASSMYRDDDGLEDLPYARPGTKSQRHWLSALALRAMCLHCSMYSWQARRQICTMSIVGVRPFVVGRKQIVKLWGSFFSWSGQALLLNNHNHTNGCLTRGLCFLPYRDDFQA